MREHRKPIERIKEDKKKEDFYVYSLDDEKPSYLQRSRYYSKKCEMITTLILNTNILISYINTKITKVNAKIQINRTTEIFHFKQILLFTKKIKN